MISLSRREVILSAAAASAVFGASKTFAILPAAAAQGSHHRFKLGGMEVITLFDGLWEKPHDPGFIKNATVDETKAALRDAGLPDATIPIPFTVTVIRMGGKTVMFDSGTGGQLAPTAGKLGASMAAAGVDPAKIDTIIVTHFHPDHIFGLMEKDTNAQVYPNAEIIVPDAEYRWWTDEAVFTRLPEANHGLAKRIQATFPAWKNLRRVEGGTDAVPGILAHSAHGHTAGHTVYFAGTGKDRLLQLADTTNIPALFVRNPSWHSAFDLDPVAAETNRRRLFDMAVAEQAIAIGYHYGMPGAGRIAKDGNGYAFTPVSS